jgi:hypothetical protein
MNKKGNRTEALKDLVIYGGLHYQQRFINALTRFTKMRGVGTNLKKIGHKTLAWPLVRGVQ